MGDVGAYLSFPICIRRFSFTLSCWVYFWTNFFVSSPARFSHILDAHYDIVSLYSAAKQYTPAALPVKLSGKARRF